MYYEQRATFQNFGSNWQLKQNFYQEKAYLGGNLNCYIRVQKIIESSNLLKLVFRSVIFFERKLSTKTSALIIFKTKKKQNVQKKKKNCEHLTKEPILVRLTGGAAANMCVITKLGFVLATIHVSLIHITSCAVNLHMRIQAS